MREFKLREKRQQKEVKFHIESSVIKGDFEFHGHDFCELAFIASGQGWHTIGDRQYQLKKGDIYIVKGKEKHGFAALENVRIFNIMLNVYDLVEEDCYFTRDETIEMQQVRDLYEEVKAVQEVSLQYQIKDNVKTVSPSEIALWIETDSEGKVLTDKNGKLIFDKDAVSVFVKELADKYDTWQKFPFVTHNGNEIVLTKGNYGIKIYQQKEVNALLEYLKNPVDEVREPAYIRNVTYQDKYAIDTTYVEVDMTLQKMMFFLDGEKVFVTDVVTGCTTQGMGTPELVCYVYGKSRNAILKGKNYRSFVNYWVPVYGGIGIHDATWRDKFGGELYIKSGSHGCINTPLERMTELYEMLEIGMPVVIHY